MGSDHCPCSLYGSSDDYFVLSERIKKDLCDNVIRKDVMGSDHCPIVLYMLFLFRRLYFVLSERIKKDLCDNVIRKDVMGSDHCPIVLYMALD